MNLDLSDEETAALANELDDVTRNDRYPFAERIRTLKAILARLQTRAGPRALAGAEDVCAAESNGRPKATARLAVDREHPHCRSASGGNPTFAPDFWAM
jgi:hypothetical protein